MITKINQQEASEIIENYKPLGLFYIKGIEVYIGINNSNGHAWVEEFETLEKCKAWLNGED